MATSKYHYTAVLHSSSISRIVSNWVFANYTAHAFATIAAQYPDQQVRSIEITVIEEYAEPIGQLIPDPINQTPSELGLDSNEIYGED